MINQANLNSTSRTPRSILQINGQKCLWETLHVTKQNYYMSDKFHLVLPLNNYPEFTLNFWADIKKSDIQIYGGFPDDPINYTVSDLALMFSGQIDNVRVNPGRRIVTLTGRDYSGKLIDKKITNTYVNQTASQVAIAIAKENGLTPVVTPTKTPVGNYFNNYTKINQNTTEWDLLTFLAQQENFNVFMINRELHFQPKPTTQSPSFNISFLPASNGNAYPVSQVSNIEFSRALTLAGDVEVKVLSYNQQTGKTIRAVATSKHTKGAIIQKKQSYVFNLPNLTSKQATARAQNLAKELSMAEFQLSVTMPALPALTKNTPIKITETGTAYDQVYYIDSINYELSAKHPFSMTIMAKNHDTNNQVSVK